MKKSVLVAAVQDKVLLTVINEVLGELLAEMVVDFQPTLDRLIEVSPALVIIDYSKREAALETFLKSAINHSSTKSIPFMFIVPEGENWQEIDQFRLGFDTKLSKQHPKLGMQLRIQAILKRTSPVEEITGKAKDIQQLVQSLIKKRKTEITTASGMFSSLKLAQAKIIVVEDEAPTRGVLQAVLERNYRLLFAGNGQEGLALIKREHPDLIISDLMMPMMDGLQLLMEVRADDEIDHTPFLFLTAKSSVEDKIEGLEHGADEYLGKPFSIRELELRVKRLIETGQQRRNAGGALQGQLSEVALPDILQVISNNRKTGELIVTIDIGPSARVYFREGEVINANYPPTTGLKAFFRILTLDEGSFLFETKPCDIQQVIRDRLDNMLLEGYRQFDEFQMLALRFPSLSTLLRPGQEKAVQAGLSTVDALVLLAVGLQASVQQVLDSVTYTDFEIMQSIIALLDVGLITSD